MARLRLFCRLRGIELPYRGQQEAGVRAAGLADALAATSTGGRTDVAVVISDLMGIADRPDVALKQLGLLRRSGQRAIFVAPFGPSFARPAYTATGDDIREILTAAERSRFTAARQILLRNGIPVVEVGPEDNIASLVRRIGRAQASMRRVA
jgi:hypothetical protein